MEIDIKGLNKAELLSELVNATKPLGMGMLEAMTKPERMSKEHAAEILKDREGSTLRQEYKYYFDYVWGRPIKANLSGDTMNVNDISGCIDAVERIVNSMREKV